MKNTRTANRKPQMKPVEVRFRKAQDLMRNLHVTSETKELQKDISWTMKTIEDYGFTFFPNLYIYDDVVKFEAMVNQLKEHPSTTPKK